MRPTPRTVWRPVVGELGFTEGPLWRSDGTLLLTSASRGVVYAVDADGAAAVLAETGGGPTGLAEDGEGTVWVVLGPGHGGGEAPPGIGAIGSDGELRPVVTAGVDAPNDVAVGPDGRLWFSDPLQPVFDPAAAGGCLRALDPATGQVEVVASGLRFPNGLAFSVDGEALYVAETATARIVRFPFDGERLGPPRIWADLHGANPDGIAFDSAGRLHVAAPRHDVVLVLDDRGQVAECLGLPERSFPTNLCFGGDDLDQLYVTAVRGGCVLALDRPVPGLRIGGLRSSGGA